MAILYKQKCSKCKKNYVVISRKQRYTVCHECSKNELAKEIKDPEMKRLFDIPEQYYKENLFLRDIKLNYLKFRNLSEKQIDAFKKTVETIKKEKKISSK